MSAKLPSGGMIPALLISTSMVEIRQDRLQRLAVGDIDGDRNDPGRSAQRLERGLVASDRIDLVAGLRQRDGDGSSYPAGGAGDEGCRHFRPFPPKNRS